MTPTTSTATDLAVRILALVAADPCITTIDICRAVRVRKSDVLAELKRLRQEQPRHETTCRLSGAPR
jgi:hypothetical protein